jgi:hypothetical protein
MNRAEELRAAIVELANSKVERGQPISLLELGPTLLQEKNFTQDEVVNTLYDLQADGVVRLLEGNRIVVLK